MDLPSDVRQVSVTPAARALPLVQDGVRGQQAPARHAARSLQKPNILTRHHGWRLYKHGHIDLDCAV